jgi:hypothetical protein
LPQIVVMGIASLKPTRPAPSYGLAATPFCGWVERSDTIDRLPSRRVYWFAADRRDGYRFAQTYAARTILRVGSHTIL